MTTLNVKNRTLFTHDNLQVMRGINSETIDLIYLDPPFNSKRNYAAPIGSQAAGAAFSDTWSLDDIKKEWTAITATHNKTHWSFMRENLNHRGLRSPGTLRKRSLQ